MKCDMRLDLVMADLLIMLTTSLLILLGSFYSVLNLASVMFLPGFESCQCRVSPVLRQLLPSFISFNNLVNVWFLLHS